MTRAGAALGEFCYLIIMKHTSFGLEGFDD